MKKFRLLTPGPTSVPENVLAKFAEPILHHRTSLFEEKFKAVQENLQWLFQTRQPVLTVTASGTGCMEATVVNLFSPGDHVLVVNAGKFGERWSKIAAAYQLKVDEIRVERGKSAEISVIEARLKQNPGIKAVLFQASETSTGALMPTQEIAGLCKKYNVLCVCDGITAVGIFDVPMDAWGIDVLMTGSQKALMLPPGLGFIALSEKAWKIAEKSTLPKFYFDLSREKKSQEKQQTAWTPAISLVVGAVESLAMLRSRGLSSLFRDHEIYAEVTRNAVKALGLELFAEKPSPVLTTVKVPASFSVEQGKKITKIMQEKFGVIITGGQDELQGKILRLSHFGYCDVFDIANGIGALEMTLKDLGYSVEYGTGVGEVLNSYQELTKN